MNNHNNKRVSLRETHIYDEFQYKKDLALSVKMCNDPVLNTYLSV